MKILLSWIGLVALCSVAMAQVPMQHSTSGRAPMRMMQRHGPNWGQIHSLQRRIEALRRENGRLDRQLWHHFRGRNRGLQRRIDQNNREIARLQRQINDMKRML